MKKWENLGIDQKHDISKAYDKVKRGFLFKILIKIGFKHNFFIKVIRILSFKEESLPNTHPTPPPPMVNEVFVH